METQHISPSAEEQSPLGEHLQPGAMLADRYLIQEVIGTGGMSAVYRARDMHFPNMVRLVAIKEMVPNTRDPVVRENIYKHFEREAHILAGLRHPAIPQIYDYFLLNHRAYLVLEFIHGKDLEMLLSEIQGFFPVEQVLRWAVELCDVLDYLHTHNPPVIFRDMKPSNVMINQSGRVVLVDFGIAKLFQGAQKGTMIGTEGYAPPEQYRGEATPLVDIYALGATLHHLLTRQDPRVEPPFSFDSRPIRAVNPAVPPELEAVVMRALAYNPANRFQSAREMKEALLSVGYKTGLLSGGATVQLAEGPPAVEPEHKAIWTFKAEDEIRSSALIHEGRVFVGSYDQNLYALDAGDGSLVWKFPTHGGVVTQPVIVGKLLVFGSEDHTIYAVNWQNGRVVWTHITEGPVRGSPAQAEGMVFIGSDDGHLYALQGTTGRVIWRFDAEMMIRSRPLVVDGRLYFGTEGGEVYCLDMQGKEIWRFRAKRAVTASPAWGEHAVFVPSVDGMLYALDAEAGWVLWRFRMGRGSISSPVVHERRVYVGSADGHLYCVDTRSSREVWRFATEHQVSGGVCIAQGRVYFGSVDGKLYCVDAEQGRQLWAFETGGAITATPVLSEKMLYIGSLDHQLYALLI